MKPQYSTPQQAARMAAFPRPLRETPAQAGLSFVGFDKASNLYVFADNETGNLEGWMANKNHASAGLRFRGTDLEFVRSL